MKKKYIVLSFLGVLVISLYGLVPVMATPSPWGSWATFPATDPAGDVVEYTVDPHEGTPVTIHDEIDIKTISIVGTNVSVEYATTPIISYDYHLSIYIDINNSDEAEYLLYSSGPYMALTDNPSTQYWNGTDWEITNDFTSFNYSIVGFKLILPNITRAITNLASARIWVHSLYIRFTEQYADVVPNPSDGGIPGFSLLLVLLSILTLLGIIFRQQKDRTNI